MTHAQERVWLIGKLKAAEPVYRKIPVPNDEQGQKDLLRILMNIRSPSPLSSEYIEVENSYLRKETMLKGIVDLAELEPSPADSRLYIWQGDITRLRVDAIVNAANFALLGCYQPLHNCIDNMIHSSAGLQLREACAAIMRKQGHDEETGLAKITPAYNLPSDYVIHTVGPIVQDVLTDEHRRLLRSCYTSCLRAAEENKLESIAFCCISTGVYHFPSDEAAGIAVDTVREYLADQEKRHDEISSMIGRRQEDGSYRGVTKVVFNVFKDADRILYEDILGVN